MAKDTKAPESTTAAPESGTAAAAAAPAPRAYGEHTFTVTVMVIDASNKRGVAKATEVTVTGTIVKVMRWAADKAASLAEDKRAQVSQILVREVVEKESQSLDF